MEWILETDLRAYADLVWPWLEADPAGRNVAATVLADRLSGTTPADGVWTAWLRDDAGAVASVALRTPPRGLLLTEFPTGAPDLDRRVPAAGLPARRRTGGPGAGILNR